MNKNLKSYKVKNYFYTSQLKIIIVLFLFSNFIFSKTKIKENTIKINSDSFYLNLKKKKINFKKNVIIKTKTFTLKTQNVQCYLTKTNQADYFLIDEKITIQFQNSITATAGKAIFKVKEKELVLLKNPVFENKNFKIKAEKIIFNTTTKKFSFSELKLFNKNYKKTKKL